MKIKVTPENLQNAIRRAHEAKCFVRHIGNDTFEVRCQNPNCRNSNRHIVEFEIDADGDLAARCIDCPSNMNRRVCLHIVDAVTVRDAMIAARLRASKPIPETREQLNARMDNAILVRVVDNQPHEFVGPIMI